MWGEDQAYDLVCKQISAVQVIPSLDELLFSKHNSYQGRVAAQEGQMLHSNLLNVILDEAHQLH